MSTFSEIILPESWQNWELTEEIGSGSFGTVYKATEKNSREVCAVKIIDIPRGGIVTPEIMNRIFGEDKGDGSRDRTRSKKDRLKERSGGKGSGEEEKPLPQGLKGADLLKEIRRREEEEARQEKVKNEAIQACFRTIAQSCVDLVRETQKLKDQDHILTIHEVDMVEHQEEIGFSVFVRMDCLQPAAQRLVAGRLAEMEVIGLGEDLCRALTAAEDAGIVHGDIKPENILCTEDGRYVLADFGIARLLKDTVMSLGSSGTFRYTAPETYLEGTVSRSTDLYGVGILLYLLMNRDKDPFVDMKKPILYFQDRDKAFRARLEGTDPVPAPAEGSEAFRNLITKACAYEPRRRYRSAREFLDDLEKLKNGSYTMKRVNTRKAGAKRKKKRGRRLFSKLAALVILCGLVLAGRWSWNHFFFRYLDKVSCGQDILCSLDGNGLLSLQGQGDPAQGQVPWKDYRDKIKTIEISDGITGISDGMFAGCEKLTEVKMGKDIRSIGREAFSGCGRLRKLDLPDRLEWIMPRAFASTAWMEGQEEPFLIKDDVLLYYEGSSREKGGESALTVPQGVKELADYSLAENEKLLSLEIPATVETIGDSALEGSDNLEEIRLAPDSSVRKTVLKKAAAHTAWYRNNYGDDVQVMNFVKSLKELDKSGNREALLLHYSRQILRLSGGDNPDGKTDLSLISENQAETGSEDGKQAVYSFAADNKEDKGILVFKEYGEWVFADRESFSRFEKYLSMDVPED